jgi:hypothetical protein
MRRIALLLLAAGVLTACATAPADSALIALDEYSIEISDSTIAAGPVPIEIKNLGEFAHTLIVTRADGSAVTATETLAPGESTSLVLDLEPGGYQVSCRIVVQIPNGTIVDHYEEGMLAALEVAER